MISRIKKKRVKEQKS